MTVQEYVPLAPRTTLGVGGTARFFAEVRTLEEVYTALTFVREKNIPLFILGGGSNIVISDEGFSGLVLLMRIGGIEQRREGEQVTASVGAGGMWDEFVQWSIREKLAGLECLSGVPGTVGGAVVANVGAYGAQCSDTFLHAEVVDTHDTTSSLKTITNEECAFAYHDSMFGHADGRYIIVRATFLLSSNPATTPSYRDNRFDMGALTKKLGHTPTQEEVRESVLAMREAKGSLIMPNRISYKSAGSFFHMPFVSKEQYAQVLEQARALDATKEEQLRPWAWAQADGSYKIAPGFLLEYTPFVKGYVRNGAGVSPRHTLSIINADNARAADIGTLARLMHDAVKDIFNISLEREVEYVGVV